jgi:hypothetical protein
VIRNRISGYSTTITALKIQSTGILESSGKNVLDALHYAKTDFNFMGKKGSIEKPRLLDK